MADTFHLQEGQQGLGDMAPADFRAAAHRVADQVADYLERLQDYPVLPDLVPGSIRQKLPAHPPLSPAPLDAILAEYARLIEPNITHWQHPGFMAYFPCTASAPGILGEWLAAGLNSNVMLWRNAPASTELEELTVSWLRQMLGLPDSFDGMYTDSASISSMLCIVAARHGVPGLDAGPEGLSGRPGISRLRMYCSTEAHSSIEKGAMVAGIGRKNVRKIPADDAYRMRPDLLAAAIVEDRHAGFLPFCVVATLGTTSSTSIDPAAEIARVCEREGLWMHVDAAYAGVAAIVPDYRPLFAGWEQADSIVINPHKWLFTPFDASLLLFRKPDVFRGAFSLVPEYLRARGADDVHDFHEYGIQLGRRFRALKVWIMLRYFGVEGLAARIAEHCRLARQLASWVEADPDWQLLAPVPFATVCFRYRPAGLAAREDDPHVRSELDARNEAILNRVNQSGEIFLSHTRLRDRYTIRVSIGNLRQRIEHVQRCWALLRESAR